MDIVYVAITGYLLAFSPCSTLRYSIGHGRIYELVYVGTLTAIEQAEKWTNKLIMGKMRSSLVNTTKKRLSPSWWITNKMDACISVKSLIPFRFSRKSRLECALMRRQSYISSCQKKLNSCLTPHTRNKNSRFIMWIYQMELNELYDTNMLNQSVRGR